MFIVCPPDYSNVSGRFLIKYFGAAIFQWRPIIRIQIRILTFLDPKMKNLLDFGGDLNHDPYLYRGSDLEIKRLGAGLCGSSPSS